MGLAAPLGAPLLASRSQAHPLWSRSLHPETPPVPLQPPEAPGTRPLPLRAQLETLAVSSEISRPEDLCATNSSSSPEPGS